ncbi:heavy metal-responsive transcriptional regulator [Rothia sp. (in: high G+C Gram-positive bacteria)]|uniref:heavy metal-responsive transcriptional regulator n=1 Tax=Rothia sp. (in: high G+C Gram-positive bacteria) TaxID=1885016 RepID=UPI00321716E3
MQIGELAEAAGTTTKTLRYYESIGLLPPPNRTPNGYRDYPENILSRLDFIRRGQHAGLSLAHIGEILRIRDNGQTPCAHVSALLTDRLTQLDHQIAVLMQLRQTVTQLHDASRLADPSTCHADAICSNL